MRVPNGGFEVDKNADGWPDGWVRAKSGVSSQAEGGNHFLRLVSSQPGETVLLYQPVTIPAGVTAIELTWRQRVSGLKPGKQPWFDARIMMEFKDAAGKKLSAKPPPPNTRKSTDGWVVRSTKFLVPADARMLEFMPALFQVEGGTFDLDDIVLKPTDAVALLASAKATAAAEKLAQVAPEQPDRAKWPAELHVTGNQVLNPAGKPVWLQGVNVVSLEFLVKGDHVLKSTLVAVDEWKANLIRLPVKEEYWFGRAGGQKDGGAAYRELVDAAVTLVANRGAYVLLDLHRFRAPRAEHAEFWKDAATRFKDHPAVLFDLFNEPHGTSWEVWRDGGYVPEKKGPADEDAFLTPEEKAKGGKGFQAIGMQALVDAVRSTGARNIVVAGGLDWAYDLSGIARGFEESGLVLLRHGEEAVLVCVDELARLDALAEDLHRAAPADGRDIRVADAEPAGEGLEASVGHLIEVAHRAVRDGAHAAERAVGVGVHLAPEGADDARLVEILHDDDFRPRHAGEVTAVVTLRVGYFAVLRVARLDDHRDRVANHRPHLRHEVARLLEIDAVARAVVFGELLPAVVDGRRVPALELVQVGVGKLAGRSG